MMLKADGFDAAIIGVAHRADGTRVLAYDVMACIDILVGQGMTFDEAEEFFWFNTAGAWVGKDTPLFVDLNDNPEVSYDLAMDYGVSL